LGVLFGTGPERIAEWLDRHRPQALTHFLQALAQAYVPPVVPTAVTPLIENYANRSFYRNRPIVPRGKEDLPAAEQSTPFTSETARLLGRALGYSPAKIDNLVRGYTGGLGRYATGAVDQILRRVTGEAAPEEPAPKDKLAHLPLIRAFVRQIASGEAESVEELYQNYTEAEGHRRTWE